MTPEFLQSLLFDYSKKINDCANRILGLESAAQCLTVLQFRLLMEIYQNGSQTVGGVAETLSLAGANASTMCKRLERSGFIVRARDSLDERIVRLDLTEKGRRLISVTESHFAARIARVFERESEASIRIMVDGMEKYSLLLSQIEKEASAASMIPNSLTGSTKPARNS